MRLCLLALLLLLAACAGQPLTSGWQDLAPGLRYGRGDPGLHALIVDLEQRRLRLTPYAERGRALSAFSAAGQALAVVNVSFFDRDFRARGHTMSEGESWPQPLRPDASPLLACDLRQRCGINLDAPHAVPVDAHTVLAGTPWLIRAGQARTAADDLGCADCERRHPRTAVGLSADGRRLILLLAEGRREGVPGLTLAETAARLRELGAHQAFNLDGGGSSSLLLNGRSVMQRPANEPGLRRVANALLIQ